MYIFFMFFLSIHFFNPFIRIYNTFITVMDYHLHFHTSLLKRLIL